MGMATLLFCAVFGTAVGASNLLGKPPKATAATNAAELANMAFHMPQITEAPSARDLARRQSLDNTVLVGPDNTCGYIDGRAGAIYSCVDEAATCVFVTTTSSLGWVACCNQETCGLRNDCVDYYQLNSQSACGYGCQGDPYTVKCSDSRVPYCATITFFDGIMDYYCDVYSGSQTQQAYTTYDGETYDHSFLEVPVSDSSSESSEFPSLFPTDTSTNPFVTATGTGDSSSPTGSNDEQSSSGGNGSSGSGSDSGSSTNIGAIVGGVVGGVALLALIALGVFFLIRKSKKDKQAAVAAGAPPPGGPGGYNQPPMDQQYGGGPSGPQSMYGQPQGFNPQQPYPPQQGYAQQPQQPGMYYPPDQQDPSKLGAYGAAAAAAVGPVDRNSSVSPGGSPHANSLQPTSPTSTMHSGYPSGVPPTTTMPGQSPPGQPQSPVYEAGGNQVGVVDYNSNHRGQFHEMG